MDTLSHPTRATSPSRRAEPERRRFTADELLAMIDGGIIDHQDRVELIDGEIFDMAAKGNRHEIIKTKLTRFWTLADRDGVMVANETPLRLSPHNEPEPDIVVYPLALNSPEVRGDTVLLVVEVSDTTIGHDLGRKARMYAAFGVREYWVVAVNRLVIHVHREPSADGYGNIQALSFGDHATPLLLPSLAIRLTDLAPGWEPDGQP
jgi:Uma2 family endonuclease